MAMAERARILVVDDEIGPRESLRMILKPNHEIHTVESGEAALRAISTFRPDLVFMDIKMPTMDGVDALRRIKLLDPSIEVVMITAYASLETVKSALTHGAFEYLVKPFSRQDLEETVRRALERRRAQAMARGQVAQLAQEMRTLAAKTRELEEAARREAAEQSLRLAQLSLLREISRGILGQLDLGEMTAAITDQLRAGLGYDEVVIQLGQDASPPREGPGCAVCPIRVEGSLLGYLVVNNAASARPLDPREREFLVMLSEYLAIALQNSRLYGEIAETKRSLEQIIRSAGEAIVSVDAEDRIVGWNLAAEQIFGWIQSEMLGRPITRLLPEATYRQAKAEFRAGAPTRVFEIRSARWDGSPIELGVTLSPMRGRGDALEGVLAMIRDITAQRELENQMLQSEKLTALGQLAGGIAHDFNNLLQSILSYAQLMKRNPEKLELLRQGLSVIETAAVDGAETVRRIQEFARLRPDEPFVNLDVNQVVREVVAITRPQWEARMAERGVKIELVLELPGALLTRGRPAQLREVMTNLILNALDAMPTGGILKISARAEGPEWVSVAVIDTGTGIPEAVRGRIFDPFFTTKGEAGTGLGLSVSYSIVKRHGGEIRAESQEGRGSTFTVRLPVGIQAEPGAQSPAEDRPRRRGRILLVDDDPQVLAVLVEILQEDAHQVTAARDGVSALAAFSPGSHDLVLTNVGMATVNGWELAERIRALDPTVPLAFITGWGLREEDRERCRRLGIRSCLFKPVQPADLLRAVQDTLTV
jgi:two-component system NtrC family sensor kinase